MRSSAFAEVVQIAKKVAIVIILLVITVIALAHPTSAMEFSTVRLNDGTVAIRGSGEIVWGDHERLDRIAPRATVGEAGERILLLDSTGGFVDAAIETAEIIDAHRFMTVVAWGDVCLSACGSVLFLSGDARLVLGDGRIGLHDCHFKGASRAEITDCRRRLSLFAGEQGYPPDLLWTGMSFGLSDGIEWANIRSSNDINCQGFQQPIGLSSEAQLTFPPCLQLLKEGRVTHGRDWDRPPSNPRSEQMVAGTPTLLYLLTWTPPGSWSYDIHEDAVSVGFRRRGHFPAGAEIEILCTVEDSASWIVTVKSDAPERFADGMRLSMNGGGESIEVMGRWSSFDYDDRVGGRRRYALAAFVLDRTVFKNVAMRARRSGENLGFDLAAPNGERIMSLTPPGGGLLERLVNVEDHCAGRYPRR